MPSANSRRRGGSKKYTVLFVLILVIAVCAIIYIAFQPAKTETEVQDPAVEVSASGESSLGLDMPEVQEVNINLRTPEDTPAEESADLPVEEEAEEVDDEERFLSIFNEYIVESGDTINSISLVSGISPQTIANVNAITDMTAIQKGKLLYIPEVDGQVYSVKSGDTLKSIIERYNPEMTEEELMALNHLEDNSLDGVDRLFIPSFGEDEAEVAVRFIRPVEGGELKYGFGEVYNDRKLEGIAIEAVPGSAVMSIASGFVADVGADPVLGRYVTVIHDEDGYRSYYYGLETVDARIGDKLEQGSIIGSVGTSSRYFGSPCLFFRLEQGVLKLNPMFFL